MILLLAILQSFLNKSHEKTKTNNELILLINDICVFKAWYNLLLCAIYRHSCPQTIINWVTCSFMMMNMGTVVYLRSMHINQYSREHIHCMKMHWWHFSVSSTLGGIFDFNQRWTEKRWQMRAKRGSATKVPGLSQTGDTAIIVYCMHLSHQATTMLGPGGILMQMTDHLN